MADPGRGPQASSEVAERLHAQLEKSLRDLVTSEDWLQALETARRFREYSFANTRLISAEAAARGFTPIRVCGYRVWQSLGRQVRRGEKGIAILAPIIRRHQTGDSSVLKRDPDVEDRRVVGFRVVHVFDVSQTEGEPLKEVKPALVAGDLPARWKVVADLVAEHGYALEVSEDPRLDGANGVTIWGDSQVLVRESLPGAQRYKTAIHEVAHIRLHDPKGGERPVCRGIVEVEAESVAYIVSAATGIDVAGYSVPYVASWSGGNPEVVAKTAQRVVACAGGILDELGLERRPERQRSAEERRIARALANGVDTPVKPSPERADAGAARLEEAVSFAADHYHRLLHGPDGVPARGYLELRGIKPETIERFQIGLAPPPWDSLTATMRRAGFSERELLEAGVSAEARSGKLYDLMRSRIVFPVHDREGTPRGLAGRIIVDGEGPKYMNTPETAIYQKRRLLYGLHRALPSIEASERAIVVEGYIDVVAAHQVGIDNTVAACGTALTGEQLAMLTSCGGAITLAFDPDEGGERAIARAYETAAEASSHLDLRVATLPEGQDPADLIAAGRNVELQEALIKAAPIAQYLIDRLVAEYDLTEPEGPLWAIRATAQLIAGHHRDTRAAAIDHLATRIGRDATLVETVLTSARGYRARRVVTGNLQRTR